MKAKEKPLDNSFTLIDNLVKENKLIKKKISKFRKEMSISWYENSEGLNTGDWIEKFDKYFKEELKS